MPPTTDHVHTRTMAEGLVRKKRLRAGHRGSTTRILNKVDSLLTGEAGSALDLAKLAQLKLTLTEKLETLRRLDQEILDLTKEDGLEDEIEQADSYKEGVYAALVKIDTFCEGRPKTPPRVTPVRMPEREMLAPATAERTTGRHVKLPKLTIRPFNGTVTDWTSFWDSYEAAIHLNSELSVVDKFNYLRSLLEGAAREAIAGLALTAANYDGAVDVLKKRFGNKQQIIARHMDALLNAEAVTSQHHLKSLRRLYDSMETHVRGLKALGVASDSYGSLLMSVLLNKLPQELRLLFSRKVGEGSWSLDTLMEELRIEIEARERATTTSTNSGLPSRKYTREPQTAAALMSATSSPFCCYCQQSHPSDKCQTVTQVEARKQILKKSGRCFVCLKKGHIGRECRSKHKCFRCGGKHHSTICLRTSTSICPPQPKPADGSTQQSTSTGTGLNPDAPPYINPATTLYVDTGKTVLLQTAQTTISNPDLPNDTIGVRVILDPGSQRSYITSQARSALSLRPSGQQRMSILAFGSEEQSDQMCDVVTVSMHTREGPNKMLDLFVVPLICKPLSSQPISICVEKFDHLSRLDLADSSDGETPMCIDVLVGSDYYWELVTGEVSKGASGPVAIHTRLGWVLSGSVPLSMPRKQSTNLMTVHTLRIDAQPSVEDTLEESLHSFWSLESLGIKVPEQSLIEEFGETIQLKNGRYEVSLPWKEQHDVLPDNYLLSLNRLQGLVRRLRQEPDILQQYDAIIQDQIQRGIVEAVEDPDTAVGGSVHYLPHHAVIRKEKKTTKVRIVYDASARSDGPSLNDCLYAGPKFDQRILDILLRFRTHKVALTADIEKAFLMVSISEKDRDVLRFLWINDLTCEDPRVCVYRFTRVTFGVSSSPFLLNATIQHHLHKYSSSHPELVEKLRCSVYVDDIVTGAGSEEEAHLLYLDSKSLMKDGGFNLRKFITSSSSLQAKINSDQQQPKTNCHEPKFREVDESYAKSALGNAGDLQSGEQRVLGVQWNVNTDHLVFNVSDIALQAKNVQPTKRNIVRTVGRFYDPMGFLAPVVVRFKVLFQHLCQAKVEWDQPLTGELLREWSSLISDLLVEVSLSMPRYFLEGMPSGELSYSLHGFCDASKAAYAAVVYLVTEAPDGRAVSFVTSKSRVSPLRGQTIPRLELLSALLLARLLTSVVDSLSTELELSRPTCYTDSKVALYWILGHEKEWKQFVQNRVKEIRSLVPISCWKHCPGRENPADLPSRGLSLQELSVSQLWREGPNWLRRMEPIPPSPEESMPEDCAMELKAKAKSAMHILLAVKSQTGVSRIISCENYSSLCRLLRVTARVLRFVYVLKQRVRGNVDSVTTELEPEEMNGAEALWIKEAQLCLVSDPKFEEWKRQFNLFLDESGVWRCGGRLANAAIPYTTKHPILLSRDHPLTILITRRAHERVFHDGVKETLTELRTQYWIIKGRSFVRKILHRCTVCRKFEGKPCQAPPPPPLPAFRVKEEPPFTHTGVDYAGPLYIKSSKSGSSGKVWLCLYTCCVVRAVHLDIVPDMTTPAFLRSLKRFSSRRGLPKAFISDNGKTFKSAAKVIERVVTCPNVQSHLADLGVKWCFNIEKAPWWGGMFERLIRSAKRCLKKMIGRARLTYDELLTVVTEVESILNSRPLSYISCDDLDEPLTPSHFLTGRRIMSLPDGLHCQDLEDDVQMVPADLSRRMNHISGLLNQFWRRWKSEYLLELRDCHRYNTGKPDAKPVTKDDVVLIHDDKPRGLWRLGRVINTVVGHDGRVRGATLKVSSPTGRSSV